MDKASYEKLFYLKYKKGLPTCELVKKFPKAIDQVTNVALMEVPETTLKEIVTEKKEFARLMELKRKFSSLL